MAGALEWIVASAPWIAGGAIAMLALGGIAWCIAGDRARGRRRCPKCWHDLSATQGLTCSECGFTARVEEDLLRTRRRIGLAAALSLGLFVAALVLRLQVSGESVWSLLPVRVPIALLPYMPSRSGPSAADSSMDSLRRMALGGAREDLLERIARGELSISDIEAIGDACAEGHDGARPGTRQWLEAYGDVVSMWLSTGESAFASQPFRTAQFDDTRPAPQELEALVALQDARRALAQPVTQRLAALPPIVILEPAPAVAGAPRMIWLGISGFMAEGGEVRVRLTATPPDALEPLDGEAREGAAAIPLEGDVHAAATALESRHPEPPLRSHAGRWIRWMPSGSGASRMPVVLGRDPHGSPAESAPPAALNVDVAWRISTDAPWRRSSFTEDLPRAAPDADSSAPRGVAGAELDAAVAGAFEDGVVLWQLGEYPAAIRFNTSATGGSAFDGVAIGLLIDLLEDGVVRRRTRIWWPGGDPMAGSLAGWEPPEEDVDALRRLALDPGSSVKWSMRIRSDPDLARRAARAARSAFWEGELTLPIRARPREGAAPSRRFTFVDAPVDAPPTAPSDASSGVQSTAPAAAADAPIPSRP
ncbi:MAG: hypothetical protein FGM37_10570 [Phycisphaerales bacterium]|nr:hypothetical protein [Phycisphaerales bacterium]